MSILTFETKLPHVVFGEGSSLKVGKLCNDYDIKKVFVVFDKGVQEVGLVDPILEAIKDSGVEVVTYSEVIPDPLSTDVNKGAALAREAGVDGVIGIGGGSAIDTAKGIHVLLGNPDSDDILDFCFGIGKGLPYKLPKIPMIGIPTTSGTGSEVSDGMVLTNPDFPGFNKKGGRGGSVLMVPWVAVLDPVLDTGLPLGQTAFTGIDALTHAIEPYLLGNRAGAKRPYNSWTDMMSLEAVSTIFEWLPKVMEDPKNCDKRAKMKYACMLAGVAMSSSALSMGHTMSYAICGKWHLPHGLGCALGLVPTIKQADKMDSSDTMTERLTKLAKAAGVNITDQAGRKEVVGALCAAIEELLDKVKMPKLTDYGTVEEDLDFLVSDTVRNSRLEGITEEDYHRHFVYLFSR